MPSVRNYLINIHILLRSFSYSQGNLVDLLMPEVYVSADTNSTLVWLLGVHRIPLHFFCMKSSSPWFQLKLLMLSTSAKSSHLCLPRPSRVRNISILHLWKVWFCEMTRFLWQKQEQNQLATVAFTCLIPRASFCAHSLCPEFSGLLKKLYRNPADTQSLCLSICN